MNALLLALYMFFCPVKPEARELPQGTQVILKAYTTEGGPVAPWDTDQAAHVNERWVVSGTTVWHIDGVTYTILSLEPRYQTNPVTLPIMWPESAVKLAFVGGPF